jgi:phenylalanyl-tRNA synthetase beta chain
MPVRRDLAIVIEEAITVQSVLDVINQAAIPYVEEVALFDLYQGKGIAENKKSLALSVLMHNTTVTLTDADVDASMVNLLELLKVKFGAELRN